MTLLGRSARGDGRISVCSSVCSFLPPSAGPLTHPFSPLFLLTGQETKEISWEQVGGAGWDVDA